MDLHVINPQKKICRGIPKMMGKESDHPNNLKSLLAAGEITQSEYDTRLANYYEKQEKKDAAVKKKPTSYIQQAKDFFSGKEDEKKKESK